MARDPLLRVLLTGLLGLCVLLGSGGCSTFKRPWRLAGEQPTPADDIQGRWQGKWKSQSNGHSGGLRGIVTRVGDAPAAPATGPTTSPAPAVYRVQFDATWGGIFHFGQTIRLTASPGGAAADGTVRFSGKENLGWLAGGVYRYEGESTPTRFFCKYRSKADRGYFEMTRPTGGR